jgi:hypothetical protein
MGEPVKLAGLQLNGISAEAGRADDTLKVRTRLSLTSDDHLFHRAVEGFSDHIEHVARQAGSAVQLRRSDVILLVVHSDNTGDLWVDTAAVALQIMTKRGVMPGTAIFENDIADVIGMGFPLVPIGKEDRIVCIFRQGWRFGLFLDFNPRDDFSVPDMQRDLGTLYRRLKYGDLYDAIADQTVFSRLVAAGWFPFVEILGREFQNLVDTSAAGFELDEVEAKILAAFDAQRIACSHGGWRGRISRAKKPSCARPRKRS